MSKLTPLISVLIVPCLGLSLLFCVAALPVQRPAAFSSAEIGEGRQPKPAAYNATRLTLLRCQYRSCARCRRHLRLARTAPEAARWRQNTRAAVSLYNQVADDTDPSAFALTALPQRLGCD